jgi:electron transfer flavoprotein alpha subunit
MIGQSGKMVSPQVYIGVGCSGEQQHMVGITGANLMVAINNDPKSPVFQQVDIGVAANCQDFLPVLISKIKAFRENKLSCKPTSNHS